MENLLAVVLGAALGGAAIWFLRRPTAGAPSAETEALRAQIAAERAKLEAEQARRSEETAGLRAERDEALAKAAALGGERAASEASRKAAEDALARTQQAYEELEKRMREAFANASQDQLKLNREQFLGLAEQRFAPFREQLEELKRASNELKGSVKETGERSEAVAIEARKLADAMRSTNRQGAWGELQLTRVVELTGMLSHVDFNTQVSVDTPEGQLRPDMVVTLPGGKKVVVDAKAPTKAFVDMGQATTEKERAEHAAALVTKIRGHATQLGGKKYTEHFSPTPEFVVLFLPSEALFSAALAEDPSLIEFAWDQKVVIATPTTLLAMLRAIAHSWQHVEVEGTALKVIAAAERIHEGVRLFSNLYADIGTNLNEASAAFNTGLTHLQSRVLGNASDLIKAGESLKRERALAEIKALSGSALIVPELQDHTKRGRGKPRAGATGTDPAPEETGPDKAG